MERSTISALAALWLFAQAPLFAQESSKAPYRLVPNWGVLPGGATWGEVPGMAIDANGKIFAFHRSEPPIVELDASGKILKMWGDKMFAWPHDAVAEGVAVDRDGNIYVGETVPGTTLTGQPGGHTVRKLARVKLQGQD